MCVGVTRVYAFIYHCIYVNVLVCMYIHLCKYMCSKPFSSYPLTTAVARARLLSLVEMSAVNPTSAASQSHLWHSFDQKVSVVLGDLAQPLLGLREDTFHSLSKSVDIIIHNGARVNHVLPYTGKLPTTVFTAVHCQCSAQSIQ